MFFASGQGFRMPLELSGFSGGNANIQQLQQALVSLAQAVRRPSINPGVVSGTINDETVHAIQSSMDLLNQHLPIWVSADLQKWMRSGSGSAQIRNMIAQNAVELTMAARTASAKHGLGAPAEIQMPEMFVGKPGSSWYQNLPVILMVAGGLFLGYKLFLAPASK